MAGRVGGGGASMNNLVHIPTTPASQRGEKERDEERGRETGRWRKRETGRGGEDKSKEEKVRDERRRGG